MNNALLQRTLVEIADQQGLSDISTRIASIRPETITIKIAFLGEFNSGKSTLINALLRRKALPMFPTPTTASITEISRGDRDEALVERTNASGEPEISPIPWLELAGEILHTALNKKVLVRLKDIDFLAANMLLVDTPGISSIQETHDDITYGYLPQVDVAIIVINPNSGTIPQTLIKFLAQFPKELLDKIYFVISRADEVPAAILAEIAEQVRQDLGQLFVSPRVLRVSGMMALDEKDDPAKRTESGIIALEDILRKEVPEKKSAIEQNRVAAGLQEEKKNLIGLLRKKLTTLDWNTDQFDKEIERLKQEIAALQKDISDYRRKFTALKGRALEAIGGIVNEYVEVISVRSVRNQPYDDLIVNMIDDIKSQVESSMNELKIIEIKFFDKNIGSLIQALVEKNAGQIKDIANLVTDAATFALTAWIVPGPTSGLDPGEALIGAGVVLAEQGDGIGDRRHNGGKVSGFGKVLGTISQMIKGMNPLEKLKNVVLPHLINPGIARALTRKMKDKLLVVYDSIGRTIEKEIETRYLTPLRDNEAVLTETRKEKSKKTDQTDADRIAIEDAISKLTLLK